MKEKLKSSRVTLKENDNKSPSGRYLDVFNFKVYCLLICRGELLEKAGLFFDLIVA